MTWAEPVFLATREQLNHMRCSRCRLYGRPLKCAIAVAEEIFRIGDVLLMRDQKAAAERVCMMAHGSDWRNEGCLLRITFACSRGDIGRCLMSIIVFILLGVAACTFSRKLLNSTGVGVTVDVCLGVIGAVIAGLLFKEIGTTDASGLIMVGIAGATVPLAS